jgi:hypothetical protein
MMNTILMEATHWTTYAQTWAAIIGVPGVVAAFIILFLKDKTQERKIASLSTIADRLTQMLETSEARYRSSKKPHIDISMQHNASSKSVQLFFKNSNLQSTVSKYDCIIESLLDGVKNERYAVSSNKGEESFSINIKYKHPDEIIDVKMNYITEEEYVFIQDIFITLDKGVPSLKPGALVDQQNGKS